MNSRNSDSAACFNSVSLVPGHVVLDCLMGTQMKSSKAKVGCPDHQMPVDPAIAPSALFSVYFSTPFSNDKKQQRAKEALVLLYFIFFNTNVNANTYQEIINAGLFVECLLLCGCHGVCSDESFVTRFLLRL